MEIILSYTDIFILGWNLNALMFVVNLMMAMRILNSNDVNELHKESETLKNLKEKFDELYPNRKYDVFISYLFPFTAFFRVLFRIIEMAMFFNKNEGTKMYHFMIYKYQLDINKAKR